jgi:hypothetical protein
LCFLFFDPHVHTRFHSIDINFDLLRQKYSNILEQQLLSSPRNIAHELNSEQAMKSKTIRGLLSGEISSPFAPEMNDSFTPQNALTTSSDTDSAQPKKVCPEF